MFTINDMMEMVKQGKTTDEIKELYAIGKEIENSGSGDPAGADPGAGAQQKEPEPKPAETDPDGTDPDKGPDPDAAGDKTDWKQKAEEITEKYNALKEKYQQQNVRQNMQGQFDDQKSSIEKGLDILSEMIR